MTFSQLELDAFRVASDLNSGNIADAAAVIRQEMYYDPVEFSIFLYQINLHSSPERRADLVYDEAGNIIVKDRITGQSEIAGNPAVQGLPPTLPPIDLGGHQ